MKIHQMMVGGLALLLLCACPDQQEPQPKTPAEDKANALPQPEKRVPERMQITGSAVAQNFDLSLIWELVQRAKDGDDLRHLLNQSGIHNLDINQDQQVDYLNLEEFQEAGQRGFILYTYENELPLEIATLTITPAGSRIEIMVTGHPRHYGDNFRYFKNLEAKDIQLKDWLYHSKRPPYQPPPHHAGDLPLGFKIQGKLSLADYQAKIKSRALDWPR